MKRISFGYLTVLVVSVLLLTAIPGCVPDLADIDPPLVNVVHPSDGSSVSGTVPIVVSASDDDKVKEIQIFVDGVRVIKSGKDFVSYSWDTTPIADNSQHFISAIAIDKSDNIGAAPVIAVTVNPTDNTPPVVNILNPIDGQTIFGNINIVADATDNVQVDRVEIYIDGLAVDTVFSHPYDYLWKTNFNDIGDHAIFARAFDPSNNTSVSPVITVRVDTTNVIPTVIIRNPLDGQIVSGTVNIAAEANDNDGIERVEFYIDGFLEQTVFTSPYHYLWNTDLVNAGDHNIYAKAFDLNANFGLSPVITVTVDTLIDNIPPVIDVVNPPDGQTVSGNINIVAEASDNIGVDRVEFFIDGFLRETVTTPPYNYLWDTSQENAGGHNLHARAFDLSGNSGVSPVITVTVDSLIDNIPPDVNIVNPLNGQIVSGTVNVVAEATDNVGVDRVEFFIDGILRQTVSAPPYNYLWNTDPENAGDHNLYAKAFDLSGNSGISPVITVTVDTVIDNIPPVVNIVNPPDGQIVSGNVNILAEATDNVGVDRVEIFIDGFLVSTASSPPYDYLWNTVLADTGIHNIFARAFDLSNNSAVSPTITVTVRQSMAAGNILPKVTIVSPGRNGIFFSESETKLIPIEVKAPKGAVGRVEFYIDGNLEKVVTNAVNDRFKFEWNTEGLGNGLLHAIFVKGFDTSLNSSADMIVVRVYP